jgi:hypothetical protein
MKGRVALSLNDSRSVQVALISNSFVKYCKMSYNYDGIIKLFRILFCNSFSRKFLGNSSNYSSFKSHYKYLNISRNSIGGELLKSGSIFSNT